MQNKPDLAAEILAHLKQNFKRGKTFTAPDLFFIAEQHGLPHRVITVRLLKLITHGAVERTGGVVRNRRGGNGMPIYRLAKKLEIKHNTSAEYQIALAAKTAEQHRIQINLQHVLNTISRSRGDHA